MTLLSDLHQLREEQAKLATQLKDTSATTARHEEQISGKLGVLTAIQALDNQLAAVKRALYAAAGAAVISSLTFAFGISRLVG
jgi:hypothetical protein